MMSESFISLLFIGSSMSFFKSFSTQSRVTTLPLQTNTQINYIRFITHQHIFVNLISLCLVYRIQNNRPMGNNANFKSHCHCMYKNKHNACHIKFFIPINKMKASSFIFHGASDIFWQLLCIFIYNHRHMHTPLAVEICYHYVIYTVLI
jgi:hypothetical protein